MMPPLADALDHDPALLASLLQDDPLEAALALARLGARVFPVHTVDAAGRCSCSTAGCRDAGKHPRTRRGLLDATTDPAVIAAWWRRWPGANPAVATGQGSGVWVLDIDPAADGDAHLALLEDKYGEIPEPWTVETGGGGLHLWFASTGLPVPSSAGQLGPGLDVRGEGGYAVVPPARHRSGGRYAWHAALRPGSVPLAPAPPWLPYLARLSRQMIPPDAPPIVDRTRRNRLPATLPEGQRNDALARLGGAMRRRGFGEAAIRAALLAENAERCAPPLPDDEVERIARYAPGPDPGFRAAGRRGGGFVEFVDGKAVVR